MAASAFINIFLDASTDLNLLASRGLFLHENNLSPDVAPSSVSYLTSTGDANTLVLFYFDVGVVTDITSQLVLNVSGGVGGASQQFGTSYLTYDYSDQDSTKLEAFSYFNTQSGEALFARALYFSDAQWDIASGEAFFFGGRYPAVNLFTKQFWNVDGYNAETGQTEINGYNEADIFDASYNTNASTDPLDKLVLEELTAIDNLSENLSLIVLGGNFSYTAGYAFDLGYESAVNVYHAGMDIGRPSGSTVNSPVAGHVIQIMDNGQDSYVVIRELDGDRAWLLGHVEASSVDVGDYVTAGEQVGTTLQYIFDGAVNNHIHIQVSDLSPTYNTQFFEQSNIAEPNQANLPQSLNAIRTDVTFESNDWYTWEAASTWGNLGENGNSFGGRTDLDLILDTTVSPLQALYEDNPVLAFVDAGQATISNFFGGSGRGGGADQTVDNTVDNFVSTFDEDALANIHVTGQEWSGASFAPYDLLRVDVDYTNDGVGDTGPVNVALYLSLDETFTADEIVHQVRFEEGVFENGTHNVWLETYLPGAEGEYHMRVTIDASGEIVESNESDNHATTVISISSDVSVGSDQRIVSATLSESEIQAGERPQFSVDIENTGAAGSGTTQLAYYRSTTTNFADAVFLGNRSVNVEAGATHTETLSLPETWTNDLASGQTYYFFAVANDEQVGSETDFSDNVSAAVALSIATQASQGDGADLIVTNQLLNGAVDENLFMVSYHIQNVGNIETNQRVEHSIWISHDEHFDPNQDSLLDVYQSSSGQIAANGVSHEMVTVNFNSYQDDPFYIFILADRENLIPEQNESNNVSDAILVQPATQPDLLSDQVIVSVELSESEIEAGERPQLTVEIENTGEVGSGTTQLAYYRSETSNFSDAEFLGNRSVNVDAGATHTETLSLPETWTSSLTEGQTYYLFAVANDEQAGSEIDFSDNISVPLALAITNGAIVGTDGNDTLEGTDGDDFLEGGRGDDVLVGGVGDDTLNGGDGSDTASYATSADRVAVFLARTQDVGGSQGIDTFISIENVIGSGFNDRLVGDGMANVLTGGLGDDVLIGNAGNDILNGGNGNDLLTGSGGNDVLNGGEGEDILSGLGGADILNGGAGDDEVLGGLGLDIVNGGTGEDDIFGFFGADTINGDAGDDNIRAGGSGDIVNGGDGNDRMVGANGKDTLWGGAGNDIYFGGFGTGGDGLRDVFVFKSASNGGGGFDIIKDFENNIDKIDLSESGYTTFVEVLAEATQVGANVQINFDFSGLLVIENFSLADFNSGDVLF